MDASGSVRVRRVWPAEYAAVGELAVAAYLPSGMAPDDPYFAMLRDVAARDAAAEVWVAIDADRDGVRGAAGGGDGDASTALGPVGPDLGTAISPLVPVASILGTVTWCPAGSPYGEIGVVGAGVREGEFRMLAVDPAAQRRGVGAALVCACLDRARAEGATGVVLSSAEWMTAAHRLYESLGFVRWPSRDWSPRPDIRLLAYAVRI